MMKIRMLIFYLIVGPLAPLFFLGGLLVFFAPFKVRYKIIIAWSYTFIFAAKYICGLSYHITGLKNLPKKNCIILCNHQSTWETIFMTTLIPEQSWVLKKELLNIPFFGWGLKLLEPIAIDRKNKNSINQLIQQGKVLLEKGRFIIIYPEGTRVAANTLGRFTRSGAALSEATQTKVIPIAHNAGSFWPKGLFIQRPGTIKVKIGPAIHPEGKTATEITELARHWIQENLPSSAN